MVLLWKFNLHQLANGAWGDHKVVQGIPNLLKVTINVLMTISESTTVITPTDSDSVCNVNVGLIEEKHCVSLDVVSNVTPKSSANKVNVFKCNDGEDLDDATIQMGDKQLF